MNSWKKKTNLTSLAIFISLLMPSTCFGHKKWNKNSKWHQIGLLFSTITMMHGPINIRINSYLCTVTVCCLYEGRSHTDWRRHLNELHDRHFWRNIQVVKSKTMRWAGHVARMGERRGSFRDLVGKTDWKRQHGHRRRLDDNIKMDLKALEWVCWTELSWLMVGKSGTLWWAW